VYSRIAITYLLQMKKIIIGIHGLSNKPEKQLHSNTWIDSINEGLTNIKVPIPEYNFYLVHWSDLLYKYPRHNDLIFYFDKLYDKEPYVKAEPGSLKEYQDSWIDNLKSQVSDTADSLLDAFANEYIVENVIDGILKDKLQDLAFYYNNNQLITDRQGRKRPVKDVLRSELLDELSKHKDHQIMLISHSMGTIIAYDALRLAGKNADAPSIEHFVTMGAPLGIPHVKMKIAQENSRFPGKPDMEQVRTPSIVKKSWVNFSDKRDKISLDTHISDDYQQNLLGVKVKDDLIWNDYVSPITKKANPHKIFGYLRSPEVAKHINIFLQEN
jgi:Lecithin:cholesterol acyltransferase